MDLMVVYVLFIVVVALVFDFFNGVKDAANSIATIVGTRVLSPRQAVIWAAFFNFIAAFGFQQNVATTIAEKLVAPQVVTPHLVLAALVAAIIWTVLCLNRGLPISVSHALIGALAGAALVRGGASALVWSTIGIVAAFIVLSSLIGFGLGTVMMTATMWVCRRQPPRRVDRMSRVLQLASAAVYSLGHGLNDAQKTMGIIAMLLLSVPSLQSWATHDGNPESKRLAWWIILSCQGAIALGTYMGGWKVVHTLGHRVARLRPVDGFCAESAGGATLLVLSHLGIPVSTTHTITGAIFGVGTVKRMTAVRWSVGQDIVMAWVLTLPCSAAIAATLFFVMSLFIRT
jgi:inorganic phosphate transporter, PiT family